MNGLKLQRKSIESFQMSNLFNGYDFANRNKFQRYDAVGSFKSNQIPLHTNNNNVSSTSTFGSITSAYCGMSIAPNGFIYGIPFTATSVLKINPSTDTLTSFGSLGAGNKWQGSCVYKNFVYGCPDTSASILKIDTNTDTTSLIGSFGGAATKWVGATTAPNGRIYFAPFNETRILALNPETDETYFVGSNITPTYDQSVIIDNLLYFLPALTSAGRIMRLDPFTEDITFVGPTFSGGTLSLGGCVANGKIYFAPYNNTRTSVLVYDPSRDQTYEFGTVANTVNKYIGAVLGANGLIYCIPNHFSNAVAATRVILVINPSNDTLFTFATTNANDSGGGVLARNGKIYCAPRITGGVRTICTSLGNDFLDNNFVMNNAFNHF